MRPLLAIAAALPLLAAAAAAQENPDRYKAAMKADVEKMLNGAKVVGIEAGIMGPAVKGAPYSADEIHETTQVLADGTRIHNETQTTVYRDSLGRVRRESPGPVMIWDSTAGASYMLNQSNQTGQKMQMNYMIRRDGRGDEPPDPQFNTFRFQSTGAGPELSQRHMVVLRDVDPKAIAEGKAEARVSPAIEPKKETLGSQLIEGVNCEGVRLTNTIEAGAIGNDRPIQTVEERWYSPELQVNLLVRKTDPRSGEDTVRLTNVRRLEPDPSLFIPPPGYQIK